MAEKKPSGRAANQGVKLLIIRDYLYSHTNENHYATSENIIKHLEEKGIRADRRTIFSDISRLENDLGLKIERKKHYGYRILEPQFEANELRLMVDSVQSAKFITQKEADRLKKKIRRLADVYTAPQLDRTAYVSRRARSNREDITKSTDVIYAAMKGDNKLRFKYFHYSAALGELDKNYSRNNAEDLEWVVSPFALYWNDGNYYLYAFSESEEKFRYFRIDRMENIKEIISSKGRESKELYDERNLKNKREYIQFKMFRGKECIVSIEGRNSILDAFVDEFGREIIYAPKGKSNFTVNAPVELSPTFYSWIASFGKKVKIIAPAEAVEGMKRYISELVNTYK